MGTQATVAAVSPPEFLRLAGDPLRWRLLGELARSDRQVDELTALVGQPQNLVSYHLGRLRRANLVTAAAQLGRRPGHATTASTWPAAAELLAAAGGGAASRPGRCPDPPPVRGRRGPAGCGCCSCAPATAPGRRSPRRCSSGRWRRVVVRAARAAIPSRCTRTRSR